MLEEISAQFGLSWGKFIAQALIFLIVYNILKKFAFGPILAMLEQRRQRIADGEAKLEKIAKDLAEAEKNAQAIIDKANADADRQIKEAGENARALAEKRQQDAVHEAGQIIAKAREAAQLEHEQLMSQLKREFGRMVSEATSRVTGKVLNTDDQARINQETTAQVSL
ncbi:MAG TPA: ATP synthase F0 subunit B [Verrucomicrobiales bacterium]|nr:ATP synthase F0 subunit B [Verrucomicrobiales bacterium]HCN76900.1 ATP synthase F0 subunit B [Verrucomicrobiales bacterium]HRJ09462.1 ATP synthase F0 subunit B [Prosthecobacter sp.]HRK13017.1 ATP synthase F0 subunit B [Prosthecobacter sp.]